MGEEPALQAPVLLHAPGKTSSVPVSVNPLLPDFSAYPLILVLLRKCSCPLLVVSMSGFHLLSAKFFFSSFIFFFFFFALPDNRWCIAGGKHLHG